MSPVPARCVLDASVVLKWLVEVDEPDLEAARGLLEAGHRGETELLAPDLVFYEVGNALRRRLASAPEVLVPLTGTMFDLTLDVVVLDDALAVASAALALEHDLTFYDAAYLATAHAADGVLVTADRRLARAAGARGMLTADLT